MTFDKCIIQALEKHGAREVWFGNPDLWHDIYKLKYPNGGKASHPIDVWKRVENALYRSNVVVRVGFIKAPGFTGFREHKHSIYALKE